LVPSPKVDLQMKIARQLLYAIPVLLLLVGCVQPQASIVSESEIPTAKAQPEPTQSEAPMTEGGPIDCGASLQGGIETTVNAQTSAFSSDDFELAYSFASPSFRSSVTLEGFVEIIAGSYGPLIKSSELIFSDCMVDLVSGLALIDVRFLQAGNDVYGLRYLMIETMYGWRVQGASNLQVVGEGA
jgi:hypothetical protein